LVSVQESAICCTMASCTNVRAVCWRIAESIVKTLSTLRSQLTTWANSELENLTNNLTIGVYLPMVKYPMLGFEFWMLCCLLITCQAMGVWNLLKTVQWGNVGRYTTLRYWHLEWRELTGKMIVSHSVVSKVII
jgi:hypothetical protein